MIVFKILLAALIVLLLSCRAERKLSIDPINPDTIRLKTWNEDTVRPHILVLYDAGLFTYEILTRDKGHIKSKEVYKGAYTFNADTVFLNFEGKQPLNIEPFLIRESTGNYLVQKFKVSAPRIFFRLPDMGRHSISVFTYPLTL
jgi:hypothetical protein